MMHFRLHFLFFTIVLSLFAACSKRLNKPVADSLTRKSEPYDHFTFQRSYPDTVFDWQGWRRTLAQTRAQEVAIARSAGPCDPVVTSTTPWTLQGPSNVAGRVNTIAVKPDDENTLLIGFGGGGIFKSTNAGANWTPVFDQFPELSIGKIAFDPSNPNTVYAGTGDVNMPSILYNGDGVYKSTNAGDSWQYLGLSQAGVISQIIVHPTDPNTIWVGTMGNPYTRTTERGVYKTTDGGQTWQKVLFVSNQAGCSSLVMSASNPQILYASFWDRLRSSTESFVWGPNAVVYKSTDGGSTWNPLTNGLPTGNNGRTGLAVSQQDANKVYVLYIDTLSTPGSMHKSTDGGNSWSPVNIAALEDATGNFGWYFGKLSLNPTNDEDIYFHGILLNRRLANGQWIVASGGHADSHDLVHCPSGRRYWANDGGLYRNEPNQQAWIKSKNLPATQVYRTNYNPHNPNEYWLGSQDNGIQRGNAQNINNWVSVISADGFRSIFHPNSSDTFWVEIQNGNLHRATNNGTMWSATGEAFGTTDRVNWDAPVFRSKNPPFRFYAGSYRLLSSPDGLGFGGGSPDLTDGVLSNPRFHTVNCVSESPIVPDKLFAGTSDGNVWRREANGTWANITQNLPDRYVTSVEGSPTLPKRIFVTLSGFRHDDYIPHIHRSDNNGVSWTDISGDLPQVPVNQIFILPGQADSILVAATDAGVYATRNSGQNWFRLGTGMPSVPAFDLAHNLVRKELVAGTFGRGIWTFPIDSIKVQQPPITPATVSASGSLVSLAGEGVAFTTFPGLSATAVSNTAGFYQLDTLAGCSTQEVKPYRNDDPVNGINAYDLVLISRHILNLEPIASPYNLIAADANKSGTITTFDIVLLRKLLLGVDTVFSHNTSWRFIPESFQFQTPDNPFVDSFPESMVISLEQSPFEVETFKAIKVGDIDNSVIAHLQGDLEDRQLKTLPILLPEAVLTPGDLLKVPVQLPGTTVSGIQFTLQFDPSVIEWVAPDGLAPGVDLEEHFNCRHANKGIVTFVFEPTTAAQPLFHLQFKVLKPGRLSEILEINGKRTPALAFDAAGQAMRPAFVWHSVIESGLAVFPNPAPRSGCWALTTEGGLAHITDIAGRSVAEVFLNPNQPTGLSGLQPGVYWINLGTGAKRITKQFIVQ